MSKPWKQFKAHILDSKLYEMFFQNQKPGSRVLPPNTTVENAKHQLRIDAGEVKTGYKNLYLQVNSEAKNTALKKFKSKHGTYANLAAVKVNVDTAPDYWKDEATKALDAMGEQYGS